MSGYVTNPFSSDFNPTSSISFSSESIPIAAYGLIVGKCTSGEIFGIVTIF